MILSVTAAVKPDMVWTEVIQYPAGPGFECRCTNNDDNMKYTGNRDKMMGRLGGNCAPRKVQT
jgi:hypothetical protein